MKRIIVKVEACSGHRRSWRLTMPDGSREYITAEYWTRKQSREALDMLEALYHFDRKAVRFDVR